MYNNKKSLFMLLIAFVLIGVTTFYFLNLNESYSCKANGFVRGSIIVAFKEGVSVIQSQEIIEALGAKIIQDYSSLNMFSVSVPILREKAYIKKFENNPLTKFAETNKCLTTNIW